MTIEQLLTDLITALKENTEALTARPLNLVPVRPELEATHPHGKVTAVEVVTERDMTGAAMTDAKKAAQDKKDAGELGSAIVTFEQCRDAIRKLASVDRPAAEALLAKFNVGKISELKEVQWADAYAEATK